MSFTHFDSRQITQFIFLGNYIVVFSKKLHFIFDISSNTQIYYLVTYFNFVCFAGLKKSEISKWTMRWGLHQLDSTRNCVPRVLVGAWSRRQSRAMPWGRTLSQRRFTLRRSVTAEKAHLAGLVRFLAIHVNFPPFSPLMFELVKRRGPQKNTEIFGACAI